MESEALAVILQVPALGKSIRISLLGDMGRRLSTNNPQHIESLAIKC